MSNEVPTPTPTPTPPPPEPKPAVERAAPSRPRKRRWFLRLFVLLVVFLLVVGGVLVAVQWALQNTDYARNIALPIVERQLGLRLHAKGLTVSLFGHTELTDVSVGLPLDKADFLQVPRIRVKHANLLQIIIDRAVTLDDVEIDRPTVDVVQDENGEWNLLQVVSILGRLGGSNNAQPTATSGGVPKLPAVQLVDGTIKLADNKGHRALVFPLNVTGQPQDLLVWKYDLSAGPAGAEFLKVAGVVAPGGSWTHEVTAAVGHLDPLAKAFGVPSTYGATVAATWDGQLSNGKVGGKLTLRQVSATDVPSLGNVGVTGSVDVSTGGAPPAGTAGPAPLVTLTPSDLTVATSNVTLPTLTVATGALTYDATGLHARGLKVNALGGAASLDLSADPKTMNVDASAHWTGLTLAAGIRQAGSLTASLRQPFPNQPLVHVELDDRGNIAPTPAAIAKDGPEAGTRWDAGVQVTGQGTTWTSIDWVLAVPRLDVDSGGTHYDLSGLSAQVQQRPTTIDLIGLTLPPAAGATSSTAVPARAAGGGAPYGLTFSSSAHVTLPDASVGRPLSWRCNVSGGLTATYQGSPVPITLAIDAKGDDTLYTLQRFAVTAADATIDADGSYDSAKPLSPVDLHVQLTQTQRLTVDSPIQGTFGGEFKVVGLLWTDDALDNAARVAKAATEPATRPAGPGSPTTTAASAATRAAVAAAIATTTAPTPAATSMPTTAPAAPWRLEPFLTTTGDLRTSELVVFGKPIGDIDVKLTGDMRTVHPPKTENGPAAADALPAPSQVRGELHSTDFYLFEAPWDLRVDYPNDAGEAELNLSTRQLPLDVLEKAAGMGSSPPVTGQLTSAHWRVTAAGPGLSDVRLSSDYHLNNLDASGLTVDAVDAAASFADGVFKLDPVTARSGTGVTHVSATYRLDRPTHVLATVAVDHWPYPLGTALGGTTEAVASANVGMDIDLASKGAEGTASADLDVLLHPTLAGKSVTQTLFHSQLAAGVHGQTLDLTDLSGRVLNGTFRGSAEADVGKPLEAVGRIEWRDVDAGALGPVTGNPALTDLGGLFSGTVTVAPSRDPRPLEPVRIDVNVTAKGGHFRSVRLGDTTRLLMTHAVAYANIDRAVLDHSDMYMAGGIVHVWGRVGRNLASQTVIVDYNDLSIDQLSHLAPAQAIGPVPGTLSGSLRVIRSGSSLEALTGGGHANILDADLVNLKAIRPLYDILQVSGGGLQPVGTGGVDFDLQAGTARVNSFRFYNRGIDAHGLLTVGPIDLTDVMSTRIGGQVVGTASLFKNSRLPFLSDFDSTFSALQSNLTTINIKGTLDSPSVAAATADEIGSQLQQLITGDAENSGK
jgi:hypothetical protein